MRTILTWTPPLLLAAAFLIQPFAPFPDLPFHLAAASIRAQLPFDTELQQFYRIDDRFGPNSLFHYVAAWIGPVTALRIALAGYVLAFWAMLQRIRTRFDAPPEFALLGFLFCINYSVQYGFIEFMISIPIFLGVLYHLGDERHRHPVRWTLILSALLLASFLAHAIMAVFALITVALHALMSFAAHDRRHAILSLAGAAPTGLAILAWRIAGATEVTAEESRGGVAHMLGWLAHYYSESFISQFGQRLMTIATADHDALLGPTAGLAIGPLTLVIGVLVVGRLMNRSVVRQVPSWPRTLVQRPTRAALALLIAAFTTVFLAPPGLPPYWSIYQRFSWMLIPAVALVALRGRHGDVRTTSVLTIACFLYSALWTEHLMSFRGHPAAIQSLATDLDGPGPGAILAVGMRYRGEPEAFAHIGNLMTLQNAAIAPQSSLYDFPFARIRRGESLGDLLVKDGPVPEGTPIPPSAQWVLCRDPEDPRLEPDFEITGRAGGWVVAIRIAEPRQ